MNDYLFNMFSELIKKEFDAEITRQDYDKFVEYRAAGKEVNGVKPVFNWINLYAYTIGMTTDEVNEIRYERAKERNG